MRVHQSAPRLSQRLLVVGRLALLIALGCVAHISSVADARPKRPSIPLCSSAQLDSLAKATSEQVVATCTIQGRAWVCAEGGKAQCCSVNDGALGHCSSSVSYRAGAFAPAPLTGIDSKHPATTAPASAIKPRDDIK